MAVGAPWAWLVELLDAGRVDTNPYQLKAHARDEGYPRRGRDFTPDVVVFPTTTDEVAAVVRGAAARRVPVTPWGAGTSTEGNALATRGGIVMDLTRMNAIVATYPRDFQAVVQPGVTRPDLNRHLGPYGLFLPPDPGAPATIGGMLGNNSSGTKSVKYGVTRDYVLGLEVVLADGSVQRTGSRAVKSSSGYDLTDLFVGSEGTLGIITQATLRVAPLPAVVKGALARFQTLRAASQSVADVIGAGVVPSAMELLDARTIAAINRAHDLGWPEEPTLLLEFDGPSEVAVAEEVRLALEVLALNDPIAFVEVPIQDHLRHMEIRHQVGYAVFQSSPEPNLKPLDVTVPISCFPDLVDLAYQAIAAHGLNGYVLGHAGDGNLHVLLLTDTRNEDLWQRTIAVETAIVHAALAMAGTTTGEHGVGLGRKRYMEREHGSALAVMKAIKRLLDPQNLLNPDKMFDL